jgi:hypothetical protein
MILTKRLATARQRPRRRPDNDPDLCTLQQIWVRTYGSEHGLAPVLRNFQNDPSLPLHQVVNEYNLHA